jgi:hypothetical protein
MWRVPKEKRAANHIGGGKRKKTRQMVLVSVRRWMEEKCVGKVGNAPDDRTKNDTADNLGNDSALTDPSK